MPDEHTIYVALDEQDFRALVAGRMATVHGVADDIRPLVKLILSDIGFDAMKAAIGAAEEGQR